MIALLALVIGLAAGIGVSAAGSSALDTVATAIEPVGTLWINAIRMTVIPLVVGLVVTGVASSADVRRIGRLTATAVPVFAVLLLASGAFAALVAPFSLDRLAIAPDAAAALRASAGTAAPSAGQMPSLLQRIVETIPVNPVKAAADGAMLPLVVFSLALGAAATRIDPARREILVRWFQSLVDAMLVMVGWVLAVAPVGIFALALTLGARMGVAAAGTLVHYILTLSLVLAAFTVLLYPVAWLAGRVRLRDFAVATFPAQTIAFSSRSSVAALPALITGARDRLGLPAEITGFVLPFAVSIFRMNVPIAWVVGALFLGKLYGVPLDAGDIGGLIVTSTLISFSVPGIPSASLFLLAPVLIDLGLPAEGVGILIAVDAVPDMFKTTINVTAHMTAGTVVRRVSGEVSKVDEVGKVGEVAIWE